MIRTIKTVVALLAFLAAAKMAHAANGSTCTRTTTVDPVTGTIHTKTVCEIDLGGNARKVK